MSDDAFHEIQLNGKQLVFLFMAATVVSVVIFLCGVLVGRGVRAERPISMGETTAIAPSAVSAEPAVQDPARTSAAVTDPATTAPPPPPEDDLTYYKRLEGAGSPKEKLQPGGETAAATASSSPAPAPPAVRPAPAAAAPAPPAAAPAAKATPAPKTTPAAEAGGEPAGDGFAVQIAALRERSEADAIATRLTGKGYRAYVLAPPSGASAAVYRVRVGKFKSRREADAVAGRIAKEEQFKPWVVR